MRWVTHSMLSSCVAEQSAHTTHVHAVRLVAYVPASWADTHSPQQRKISEKGRGLGKERQGPFEVNSTMAAIRNAVRLVAYVPASWADVAFKIVHAMCNAARLVAYATASARLLNWYCVRKLLLRKAGQASSSVCIYVWSLCVCMRWPNHHFYFCKI